MRADKFLQDIPYVIDDFFYRCNKIHKRRTLPRLPVNIRKEIKITANSNGFTLSLDYCDISIKAMYSFDDLGIELTKIIENGSDI